MGGVWLLSAGGRKLTHAEGGGCAVNGAMLVVASAAVQQLALLLQPCWAAL